MTLLRIPNVLSPSLCTRLIALHATTNRQSGFMWPDADGKYAERIDPSLKQRTDHYVVDQAVVGELQVIMEGFARLLMPAGPMFVERHLVARYDAPGGQFAEHSDTHFPGTRHRQWAVSVALNEDFVGGELRVRQGHTWAMHGAETGSATAFYGSIPHKVAPVKFGSRFVYLTFLYDEAHEAIRQSELSQLA